MLIIASAKQLTLLTTDGELIETVVLPETLSKNSNRTVQQHTDIEKIALDGARKIHIQLGDQNFYSDDELISWHSSTATQLRWSQPQPLPAALQSQLERLFRSQILPVERLVLDLHSGRFFGPFGVYLVDAATIALIFLALSGCWIWLHHKFRSFQARRARSTQ